MLNLKFVSKAARAIVFGCLSVMILTPSVVTAKGDVIKWRMQSHLSAGGDDWDKSVVALKDKLYERTDGRLEIELHTAGSLFGSSEIFPAVSGGIMAIGHTSPAYIMNQVSTAALAWGPSSFRSVSEATYFWKHLGFEDLIREEVMKDHNMYYFTDLLYFTALILNKPVDSVKDFESLRIRAAGSLAKFVSDAGAATTFVSGPELYQALSTHAVDGAHWGAAQNADALSLYESAKYHTTSSLGIANEIFLINKDAMAKLPEDMQMIVKTTLEEHFWLRTNEFEIEEREKLRQLVDEKGVEIIDLPDEIQNRMYEAADTFRQSEAGKSEYTAEAVKRLEAYLKTLGYL